MTAARMVLIFMVVPLQAWILLVVSLHLRRLRPAANSARALTPLIAKPMLIRNAMVKPDAER
jgi:hypothetical protein